MKFGRHLKENVQVLSDASYALCKITLRSPLNVVCKFEVH